jgi:uncharacterized protein YggE
MTKTFFSALLFGAGLVNAPAFAQQALITQTIAGTRLDINATGEVTRVPDVAVISAGVVSRSPTATGALQDTADRMQRVLAALKRAGVVDRDVQTSNISLNPEYRYPENQAPQLVGYTASNSVTVRFRDIRTSGKIIDALVGQGANQVNGPNLVVDKPEAALDEARAKAIASGRARAELYARAVGMHIVRIVSINETAGYYAPPPPAPPSPMVMARRADSSIEPGEQKLQVSVAMTFELQ